MLRVVSDADRLLFAPTPFERSLIDALPSARVPSRWCAMNAVWHLNRAWKIKDIDREMAALRMITAEEEMASAIFHTLKSNCYEGAERLALRSHTQKRALTVFIDAVARHFAATLPSSPVHDVKARAEITEKGPVIEISFALKLLGMEDYRVTPVPPLHFNTSLNDSKDDFKGELQGVMRSVTPKEMETYFEKRAEERTSMLYAANEGVRRYTGDIDANFAAFRSVVFRDLFLFLAIELYREKQAFVQQCLDAFLSVVTRSPKIAKAAEVEAKAEETETELIG